jgi:hypothetical protein
VENRRGDLIYRNCSQGESENQQKKPGSYKAPRLKKSTRKNGRARCIRRRHYCSRTSDATLTDNSCAQPGDLIRMSPPKEEIADGPNQGCRAGAHSGHFVAANVMPVPSRCAKGSHKNDQTR